MAKKYRVDKEIALLLCRAQNASDGGKYYYGRPDAPWHEISLHQRDFTRGYNIKDELIMKACSLIACNKSSFSFSIQACNYAHTKALIYFNFRLNGEKRQISFHSLQGKEEWGWGNLWNNKAHKVRFDKGSSREAANDLIHAYRLNYKLDY